MNKLLTTKRVWIITLVFLLCAAGLAFADYTMPDGTVVHWVEGNTLEVISTDGTSHTTTGQVSDSGRLVPTDNSVNSDIAYQIPAQNTDARDGMRNTNMSVPIVTNGQVTGYADIYGSGVAYQGDTAVRSSNESQGNSVGWDGIHSGYGGGFINISSGKLSPPASYNPSYESGTLTPASGGSSNSGSSNSGGGSWTPPTPFVITVMVSGSDSATAAQSYSYTATATYSNGNTTDVTGSASWSNGPTFSPQNEGTYTVSATYAGITGSKQVSVVLPPAATPPVKPPVRLY